MLCLTSSPKHKNIIKNKGRTELACMYDCVRVCTCMRACVHACVRACVCILDGEDSRVFVSTALVQL